ncbi:MAG: ACT domain-containing protein [Acidimicrobiales bacterium]
MVSFVVRVMLPDRPGALGAVASRIGSVRGDVVSVEVVEHGGGLAVDEFVVSLPDADNLGLLVSEIAEVDGASVEDVHPVENGRRDRRLDAYDAAKSLLRERSPEGILGLLATLAGRELDARWVAVLDPGVSSVVAYDGRPPSSEWLAAHVTGGAADGEPVHDVAVVDLVSWDLVLMAGRPGWRIGPRELARLEALCGLADARWSEVGGRDQHGAHTASTG